MSRDNLQTQALVSEKDVVQARVLLPPTMVADRAGLARLENEWRGLANASPLTTIFQTWEWNAVWWQHFGGGLRRRLRIIVFRSAEDGALVGLAPFYVSFWYGLPLRRLSFLGTGTSDYLDALAAPGWEEIVAEALYGHLSAWRGWDVVDFQQLPEGGLLRSRLPKHCPGLECSEALREPCPYLALPGTWDALKQQFGKKTRTNIGYYDRALQKVYRVDVEAVSQVEALDREMTRLFALHQRRWNQRWLPGVFGNTKVRAFHRMAAHALLSQGWLRLYTLKLDGETQASLYCFAFGDRICYYQGGFEPTLAKWSLGTVLTARALQDGIAEKRSVFDFLRGDEPYKAKWTQTTHINSRRLLTRTHGLRLTSLARQVLQGEWTIERRAKAWARKRSRKS